MSHHQKKCCPWCKKFYALSANLLVLWGVLYSVYSLVKTYQGWPYYSFMFHLKFIAWRGGISLAAICLAGILLIWLKALAEGEEHGCCGEEHDHHHHDKPAGENKGECGSGQCGCH